MKFDWENWNIGGKIIFVASCVAILSMFMNWFDMGIIAQNGFAQGGVLFLAFWIYPVLVLLSNKSISRAGGISCSVLSVLLTLIYINSKTLDVFDNITNFAGVGAWTFAIASVALVAGIAKYKSSSDI